MSRIAALAATTVLFGAGAALAEPLKVCTVEWPPYTIGGAAGKEVSGTHTDLVVEALKRLGFEAKVDQIPWERCLKEAENGRYDVVYSASYKPERAAFAVYPKRPLQSVSYVAVVAKGTGQGWGADHDPAKLPQPVAAPLGFSITADLKKMAGVTVDDGATTDQQNLQKLLLGRVKAMVVESSVAKLAIDKAGAAGKVEVLSPPVQSGKDYFAIVSRKHGGSEAAAQALADRLDQVLGQLEGEGFLARVTEKYLKE
jgi:polar amino acid transport system substrate-binding protein